MNTPLFWLAALLVLVLGCSSDPTPRPAAADLSTVTLERDFHFQTPEGTDTVIAPGHYMVGSAGMDALQFTTSTGETITVEAKSFSHDLPVRDHFAMLIPEGDDDRHVVLLLHNGMGLDAIGSVSGIRSRAGSQTLQATTLQLAAQVQPQFQAIGFSDPCAGASPSPVIGTNILQASTPVSRVSQNQLEFAAQTGKGPIPDITDWIPRAKVAGGAEIRIQGRNLDPNTLMVRLGGDALVRTGQSPGEVRFRAPGGVDMTGASLVVYHIGGQARTLEPTYRVFDPVVRITRVSPTSFREGDLVTICGNSLFNAGFITPSTSLNPQFIGVGNNAIEIMEPAVSPSGDRMSVRVTRAAETFISQSIQGQSGYTNIYGIRPLQPQPSSLGGQFKLALLGVSTVGTNPLQANNITGPSVTWQPALLQLRTAYNQSRFPSLKVPFVIATNNPNDAIYRQISFEGTGLSGASLRIGAMGLQPSIGSPGLNGAAVIPANASNGNICATKNNQTVCSPEVIQVIGGPTMMQLPAMPLAMFVTNSISGLNLAPSGVSGLTYEFRMSGLRSTDSGAQACNVVMQVLEHSPQRISFRIGDSSRPVPASCLTNTAFNTSPPQYVMQLIAKYAGAEVTLWEQPYGLKKP